MSSWQPHPQKHRSGWLISPAVRCALVRSVAVALALAVCSPALAREQGRAARAYEEARGLYFALKRDTRKQRYRHNWQKVIAAFTRVAAEHTGTGEAVRATYTAAELWKDLHAISRRRSDLDQALAAYARVVARFPGSSLADDALLQHATLALERRGDREAAAASVRLLLERYPKGDMAARAHALHRQLADVPERPAPAKEVASSEERSAEEALAAGPLVGRRDNGGETPVVTEIKQWSNPTYSRVAIYLTGPAHARSAEVAASRAQGMPARVAIDIDTARLGPKVAAEQTIEDDLLASIRAAQHDANTVRVVLDLDARASHRVMVMENPYRVVVDAFAAGAAAPARPEALLKGRRVVIDPGHGGKDGGASGPGKLREKAVTLAISREVSRLLEAAGVDVVLTREGDAYVALEERTAIANRSAADLFVSIHANSHRDRKVTGVETYYLDVTDDRYALRLAAIENQTSEEQVSDLQLILADLATKVNTDDSSLLARSIQHRVVAAVRGVSAGTRDLGVKPSLFYVLLGARMPAVLAEVGFISNAKEGRLLGQAAHQRRIARAIADAVIGHFQRPLVAARP